MTTQVPLGLENRVISFTLGASAPQRPNMIEDVLDVLGAEVWFTDLPSFVCGRTVYRHGVRRIELSDAETSERARTFTLGHEIGHCLVDDWLDESRAPNYLPDDTAAVETLCNRIAAELLLPRGWIVARISGMGTPSADGFAAIATASGTSLAAVLVRALQLRTPVVGKRFDLQRDGSWRLARSYGRDPAPRRHPARPHRPSPYDGPARRPLGAVDDLPADVTRHLTPTCSWTSRRSPRTLWLIGSTTSAFAT